MGEKHKEIDRINNIRDKLTTMTEKLSVGNNMGKYIGNNPVRAIVGLLLLGFITAIFSTALIRLIFFLITFSLRIAAFVFVAKQAFSKVSAILKVFRRKK